MSKYRHFNSFMKMFLSSLNRTVSVLHNINLTKCIRTNVCDLYAVKLKQITVSHQNRPLPAVTNASLTENSTIFSFKQN